MIYIPKKGILVCKVNDAINKHLYFKKLDYFLYGFILFIDIFSCVTNGSQSKKKME